MRPHKLHAAENAAACLLVSYTASLVIESLEVSGASIIYTNPTYQKRNKNKYHTASSSSPSSKMAAGATRATRENGVAGCLR